MNPAHVPAEKPAPLRVLLADDTMVARVVAKSVLEKAGCEVRAVVNGAEALRALGEDPYDLVVLDGQMPELGGADTAKAIRSHGDPRTKALPVIGLTAGEADEQAELLAAGMDVVVAKPVHAEAFAAAVEAVLAKREKPTA